MTTEEKLEFLHDIGLEKSGLDRLILECYKLLGLISFLTAGKEEVRAWTIKIGTKAPQAAGKIHSDFERGFIRAEVISYENLVNSGNINIAKERGLVKSEGKEYAKVNVKYYVREGKNVINTYEEYTLRKDEEGKWRILYWELSDAASMEE